MAHIVRRGGTSSRPFRIPAAARLVVASAGLLLALVVAGAAAAHGGAAGIVVSPDPANPGGTIEIRGEDLGADEPIRLVLVASGGRAEMATVDADPEGHLLAFVRLPADLPEGIYAIEAVDAGGAVVKAALEVRGPAIVDAEEDPLGRDEDDPLLIALPADWQRSLSGPVITAVPVTSGGSPAGAEPGAANLALVAALVLGIAGALALGAIARRRARAPR